MCQILKFISQNLSVDRIINFLEATMITKNKVVKIGIMSLEEFKKRTLAIAMGQYKPQKTEPKI